MGMRGRRGAAAAKGVKSKRRRLKPVARLSTVPPEWGLRYLPVFDAGMTLTEEEALTVSAVFACVDIIVRAIAPAPWAVFQVEDRKRERLWQDPIAYTLNTRANPDTTAIAVREALLYSALISGNGYAEIQRDMSNKPVWLWPIDPAIVTPRRNDSGELGYEVRQYQGGVAWLPAKSCYHLRGPSLMGMVGDNVIFRASKAIAVAAAAQQFASSYFANGTVVSGVLQFPGKMDEPTRKRLATDWVESHGGKSRHKPVVLEGGLEWKQLSADPDKAQLLDTRKFAVAEVARFFGVPMHKLADPSGAQGYGSNLEALELQFVLGCLSPWTRRLEQEADFKLFGDRAKKETKIDLSKLHQGDFKTRQEGFAVAKKNGAITTNEWRESEGWNSAGSEGDIFTVESTMKTVEDLINPPEPPAAAPPEEPAAEPVPAPKKMPANPARAAVALDRFARRLQARKIDLEAHAPGKVAENIAREREKLAPALIEECRQAQAYSGSDPEFDARVLKAADAVLEGEPAHLAVSRLLEVA